MQTSFAARIFKNTGIIATGSIASSLVGFFIIALIVRHYGLEHYGVIAFFILLSVDKGVMAIFDFGVKISTTKFIAHHSVKKDMDGVGGVVRLSLLFSLVVGSVISLFMLFFSDVIAEQVFVNSTNIKIENLLHLFLLTYIVQYFNYSAIGIFEGFQKYKLSKGLEFFGQVSILVVTLASTMMNYPIETIVYGLIASHVLIFVFSMFFLSRIVANFSLAGPVRYLDITNMLDMLKNIFPTQVSSLVFNNYPKLFVLYFLGEKMLGIYDIISKIPKFLKTLSGFLNSALVPAASEIKALGDRERLQEIYRYGFRINVYVMTPVLSCVAFFSPEILQQWIGREDYHEYVRLLLIWNLLIPYVNFGAPMLVGMGEKLRFMRRTSISITLVSMISSLFLIQKFGLLGLIFGFLSGFLLLPFVFSAYGRIFQVSPISTLIHNLKVYFVAVVLAVMGSFFNVDYTLPVLVMFGILWVSLSFYMVYLFIANKQEKEFVRVLLQSLSRKTA